MTESQNPANNPSFELQAGQPESVLVFNCELVSPELAGSLTSSEIWEAQFAFNVLQSKSATDWGKSKSEWGLNSIGHKGKADQYDIYQALGFDGSVRGFKNLRRLAGEEEFDGLEPVNLATNLQTPFDDYLALIHDRKLTFTDWNIRHDLIYHFVGGLLATGEFVDYTQSTVGSYLALPDGLKTPTRKENLVRNIDSAVFNVQNLWETPVNIDATTRIVAARLTGMRAATGLPELEPKILADGTVLSGREQINNIASGQAKAIQELIGKRLFVHTPASLGRTSLTGI